MLSEISGGGRTGLRHQIAPMPTITNAASPIPCSEPKRRAGLRSSGEDCEFASMAIGERVYRTHLCKNARIAALGFPRSFVGKRAMAAYLAEAFCMMVSVLIGTGMYLEISSPLVVS